MWGENTGGLTYLIGHVKTTLLGQEESERVGEKARRLTLPVTSTDERKQVGHAPLPIITHLPWREMKITTNK